MKKKASRTNELMPLFFIKLYKIAKAVLVLVAVLFIQLILSDQVLARACETGEPYPYQTSPFYVENCPEDVLDWLDRANVCTHSKREGVEAAEGLECADLACDYNHLLKKYDGNAIFTETLNGYEKLLYGEVETLKCNSTCETGEPFPFRSSHQISQCPDDIQTFMNRVNVCGHFMGEEGYNKERASFLISQIEKYSCARLGCDYKTLFDKYEGDIVYTALLIEYTDFVFGGAAGLPRCN